MPQVSLQRLAEIAGDPRFHRLDWLTESERDTFERLRGGPHARRWLAGRWLAKSLVRRATDAAPADVEIVSRDGLGRPIRPRILVCGRTVPWDVSLSHSGETVAAVVALESKARVGVDVVTIQCWTFGRAPPMRAPLSKLDARLIRCDLWFTPAELDGLETNRVPLPAPADARELAVALLWAAKEAAYKATNRGEKFVPRSIEITRHSGGVLMARRLDRGEAVACRSRVDRRADHVLVMAEASSP